MRGAKCWMAVGTACAVLALQVPLAQADNSQQTKMTSCNADAKAKNLSGDDRKSYMKSCLSGGGAAQ